MDRSWLPIDEYLRLQDRRRGGPPRQVVEQDEPTWRVALKARLERPGKRPGEDEEEGS